MAILNLIRPPLADYTGPAIRARGLAKTGPRGEIYGPLDLDVQPGTLTLVTGHAGAGKTALLLSLVARMKPDRGSELRVLGNNLPAGARTVQHASSAVGFAGLDDLDEEVSVRATIREREAWVSPALRIVRMRGDDDIAVLCAPAFGERPAPSGRDIVHSLHEADNLLLRLALALMTSPRLIAVDDVDSLRDTEARTIVWERLHAIADTGITVLAGTSNPADVEHLDWPTPPEVVALPDPDHAL